MFDPATRGNGAIWAIALSPDKEQRFLIYADGENNFFRVIDRKSGEVLGSFGRSGRNAGQFHWVHQIGIDSKANIYTGEVDNAKRIQKFVPVSTPRNLKELTKRLSEDKMSLDAKLQARGFGGLLGVTHGVEIVPKWVRYLKMTATATLFTSSGFAMAADGRQSWGYSPTLRSRQGESETVQKIFEITRTDSALAYCIRGDTVNEDMSWDIAAEIKQGVASLSPKRFANSYRFIRALCLDVQGRIEYAKQQGQLEGYPTTELCFVGYFRNAPCWIDVQFHRNQSGLLYRVRPRDCDPRRNYMSGSQILNDMILGGDPRVAYPFLGLNESVNHSAGEYSRNGINTNSISARSTLGAMLTNSLSALTPAMLRTTPWNGLTAS